MWIPRSLCIMQNSTLIVLHRDLNTMLLSLSPYNSLRCLLKVCTHHLPGRQGLLAHSNTELPCFFLDLQRTFMQCGHRQKCLYDWARCSHQKHPFFEVPQGQLHLLPIAETPSSTPKGSRWPCHHSKCPLVPCCCVHLARPWRGHQTQGAGRGISEACISCRRWHYRNLWLAYHHQNNKIKVL